MMAMVTMEWDEAVLWAAVGIVLVLLAVLDSTRVLMHIYVFTGIAASLYLLSEFVVGKSIGSDETSSAFFDARWKVYLLLGSIFYVASCVSGFFAPLVTTLLSVLWLCSLIPLLAAPFACAYAGSLPAALTLVVAVATATGAVSLTMGILLTFKLGLMAGWRIKGALQGSKEDRDVRAEHPAAVPKRILISVAYVVFAILALGVSAYWIALSIDCSWTHESIELYSPLHHCPVRMTMDAQRIAGTRDVESLKGHHGPWLIRPNVCTAGIGQPKVCRDHACLVEYISKETLVGPQKASRLSWLIQEYAGTDEAVVLYYRYPYLRHGAIKSITNTNGKPTHNPPGRPWFFDALADGIPGLSGGHFRVTVLDGAVKVLEIRPFPVRCLQERAHADDSYSVAISRWARRHRTALLQAWLGAYNILSGRQLYFIRLAPRIPALVRRYALCNGHPEHLLAIP
jgi:hypothetical protein